MEPYRSIVAGVHDTERGLRVVDRAIEVAGRSRAALYLATATGGSRQPQPRDRSVGEAADGVRMAPSPPEPVLQRCLEQAREHGVPEASSMAWPGRPVDVLIDAAASVDAGLVVVGSHGVNTTAGRVFGSVAAGAARRASSDVLIVHTTDERWHLGRARRRRLGPTAAPYRRVLVGVHRSTRDSTSMSRVVETGAEMAAVCDAEIILSSSYEPARPAEINEAERILGHDVAYLVTGQNPVEATLEDATRTAVAVGARAPRTLSVPHVPAARALVDQAGRTEADLVVVGSHGLHGPPRRLLGAVAASVFRHTPADVLIVDTEHLAP